MDGAGHHRVDDLVLHARGFFGGRGQRLLAGDRAHAQPGDKTMPDGSIGQNEAPLVEEPKAANRGHTEPWSGCSRCGRTR
jgi:hypothetical protein